MRRLSSKIFFALLFSILLIGCTRYKFIVRSENVVQEDKGLILFIDEYAYFLPSKIDTTIYPADNFRIIKSGIGFQINSGISKELWSRLKYMYADSLSYKQYIVPVTIKYIQGNETNKKLKKEKNRVRSYFALYNDEKVIFNYTMKATTILKADPYISKKDKLKKENEYLRRKGLLDQE